MTLEEMKQVADRMDALAQELDGMARWMDTGYLTQKWVHRDLRSARAAADRIAAHFRQELAEAEQTSRHVEELARIERDREQHRMASEQANPDPQPWTH
jgi:hypothetical protein